MQKILVSEAVTEGHPDKICDQIADAILDDILSQDRLAHVAVEAIATRGLIVISGEVTTTAYCDVEQVVRNVLEKIGYNNAEYEFDSKSCGLLVSIHSQSPDIAQGVREEDPENLGAGDQGIVVGYATDETEEFMPLATVLANKLAFGLSWLRKNKVLPYLRPDGKVLIGLLYEDEKPTEALVIVIAAQHDEVYQGQEITAEKIKQDLIEKLIKPTIGKYFTQNTKVIVNGTGRFVIGGPAADSGLTGRKIIADNYGPFVIHGGGSFSGKDPTKIDRSGAYIARYIAKNVVAAGLAKKCLVQISYAIGLSEPLSLEIETFGTEKVAKEKIIQLIKKHFDLRPGKIIEALDLRRPIYLKTAVYGHFGKKDPDFSWEKTDKAELLKKEVEKG